jgi:predicted enzyme related to lactoylglutathione lyase
VQVGKIDFVAVPVTDLAAADAFYGETVGLVRNPNTSGERWVEYETGNLTIALSTFGGTVALGVADVGEARRELEADGVEFHMDTFDSGVCNGAPFTDPDGNRLLLHRRYAPLEPFATPAGGAAFIGVSVADPVRAGAFYGETLGLKRSADDRYDAGNVSLLLGDFGPGYTIALRVPDVPAGDVRDRDGNALRYVA